jgi:hypothetical protein
VSEVIIAAPAVGVRSVQRIREVSEMLTGEMAKYQIEDRIRAAQHDHASRSTRAGQDRRRSPVVRRVASGLLAAVVGRWGNATPTSAGVEVRLG